MQPRLALALVSARAGGLPGPQERMFGNQDTKPGCRLRAASLQHRLCQARLLQSENSFLSPQSGGLQGEECSQMLPSTLLQSPASPLPRHAVSPHWLLQPGLPPSISLEAPHPPSLPRNLVQGPAGHPAYPRLCLSLSAEPSRDTTLRGTVWSGHPGV